MRRQRQYWILSLPLAILAPTELFQKPGRFFPRPWMRRKVDYLYLEASFLFRRVRKESFMATISQTCTHSIFELNSEKTWMEYISLLRSYARRFVYSAKVPCWRYQEEDIVEDIVQETIRRFIERYQQAKSGEMSPIRSPKHVIGGEIADCNMHLRMIGSLKSHTRQMSKRTCLV